MKAMMKQSLILFLQGVIVLIGILALVILIRFPLTEGRAKNLDLFHIYADPFLIYGFAASILFFIALYKAFKLVGYFGQNKAFTVKSIKTLKGIKYCAILLSLFLVLAGLYIRIFHDKDDDPAGFISLCIVGVFINLVIASAISVFEKILQNGIDLKTENEQLGEFKR